VTPTYIGIDPGLDGAIALLSYQNGVMTVKTFDMPTFLITVQRTPKKLDDFTLEADRKRQSKTTQRQRLDLHQINALLYQYRSGVIHAVVEDPHAMPKQGVSSSFSFGFVCGVLQAMIVAHGIPMTLIKPALWKGKLGLTADKDATRRRASQLFPACASQWARKCDDGRAEAALLAYWGQVEGVSL